jgi:hypothetical protein
MAPLALFFVDRPGPVEGGGSGVSRFLPEAPIEPRPDGGF